MNKLVIGFGVFCLAFIFYSVFQPASVDGITPIEHNSEISNKINEMKLDPDDLLEEQKQFIINEDLTYLASFEDIGFIMESDNMFRFQRHWGMSAQYDYDTESQIKLNGYLFKDHNEDYQIMINYSYDHLNYGTEDISNKLTLDYSKHYKITSINHYAYFVMDGKEYEVPHTGVSQSRFDETTNEMIIPQVRYEQTLKTPEVKGFIWIKLQSEDDYNSDLFECDIDFYEYKSQGEIQNIVLGFNSFRLPPKDQQEQYIPSSMKVIYIKERD